MKNDTAMLIAGGLLLYAISKRNSNTTPDVPFQETPLGFTSNNVQAFKDAGYSNADIVNAALNPPKSIIVKTSKGGSRTISTPPPGATKTSLNRNQYLAPRAGGGYKVVGARNITLN